LGISHHHVSTTHPHRCRWGTVKYLWERQQRLIREERSFGHSRIKGKTKETYGISGVQILLFKENKNNLFKEFYARRQQFKAPPAKKLRAMKKFLRLKSFVERVK